jgi:hypothetical protein
MQILRNFLVILSSSLVAVCNCDLLAILINTCIRVVNSLRVYTMRVGCMDGYEMYSVPCREFHL